MTRYNPLVSVVMSVYNGAGYLAEAVDSILRQTYNDFEFIIIDDASTDNSAEILSGYSSPHIVPLKNESNIGLTASLNMGMKAARGRYIARMDADDISEPDRFAQQVAFLETNPEVTVLGTSYSVIDEAGLQFAIWPRPTLPHVVAWDMCRGTAIAHPSVMMRREPILALGGYDTHFRFAQDYDLWTRVIMAGGQIANLDTVLIRYRHSSGQVSQTRKAEQRCLSIQTSHRFIEWMLGESVPEEHVLAMWRLLYREDLGSIADVQAACRLMWRLYGRCQEGRSRVERWEMGVATREALLAEAYARIRQPRISFELFRSALSHPFAPMLDRRLARQVQRAFYYKAISALNRTKQR